MLRGLTVHLKLRKFKKIILKINFAQSGKIILCEFTVQDIAAQLSNFVKAMMEMHAECRDVISGANGLFPIDIDLEQVMLSEYYHYDY